MVDVCLARVKYPPYEDFRITGNGGLTLLFVPEAVSMKLLRHSASVAGASPPMSHDFLDG